MAKDTCESSGALLGYDTALWAIIQVHCPIILLFSTLIMNLDGESPKMMSGLALFMDAYFLYARTLRICTIELSFPERLKLH